MQRLLVTEDEPGIRTVVSQALSSARFPIDHLVLVDLMGSGLDGVGSAGLRQADAAGDIHAAVRATSGSIADQATTRLTVK